MNKAIFITGTDTGIGKTFVACALIRYFAGRGLVVAGYKPVAAGASVIDDELQNEDAIALWQSGSAQLTYQQVNPVCLPVATSPHLAAEEQGVELNLQALLQQAEKLRANSDLVVAEGAGGWRVPLAQSLDISDVAIGLGWPVLLVVGLRLGCINHARLTLAALHADGVEVCGWIANQVDPDLLFADKVLSTLVDLLDTPLLAKVNFADPLLAWTGAGEEWQENLQIVFDS